MAREEIEFQSDGATCRGFLLTPDDAEPPYPTVVLGGGWTYVKELVLPDYSDRIVEEGIACLGFDYRNFGDSDVADQEQYLDPWKQIEDYQSAITYVEARDDVDEDRIGLFGISYSGGHALIMSGIEPRLEAVVSVVPLIDGYDNMKRMHTQDRFYDLLDIIVQDRRDRVDGESGTIPFGRAPNADWDDGVMEVGAWPLEVIYEIFMNYKETVAPNHKHWSTIKSVDDVLNYTVFPYVRRNYNTPTRMVITEKGESNPVDHQVNAFNELATPKKDLTIVPADHHAIYHDKGLLEIAADEAADWYREHLVDPYE